MQQNEIYKIYLNNEVNISEQARLKFTGNRCDTLIRMIIYNAVCYQLHVITSYPILSLTRRTGTVLAPYIDLKFYYICCKQFPQCVMRIPVE